MNELHTGPKHPMSGTKPESYFDLHVVPLETNQEESVTAGTWCIITRLTPGGSGSLALVDCPPRRGELR